MLSARSQEAWGPHGPTAAEALEQQPWGPCSRLSTQPASPRVIFLPQQMAKSRRFLGNWPGLPTAPAQSPGEGLGPQVTGSPEPQLKTGVGRLPGSWARRAASGRSGRGGRWMGGPGWSPPRSALSPLGRPVEQTPRMAEAAGLGAPKQPGGPRLQQGQGLWWSALQPACRSRARAGPARGLQASAHTGGPAREGAARGGQGASPAHRTSRPPPSAWGGEPTARSEAGAQHKQRGQHVPWHEGTASSGTSPESNGAATSPQTPARACAGHQVPGGGTNKLSTKAAGKAGPAAGRSQTLTQHRKRETTQRRSKACNRKQNRTTQRLSTLDVTMTSYMWLQQLRQQRGNRTALQFKAFLGLPWGPAVKNPPANARNTGSIRGWGGPHVPRGT